MMRYNVAFILLSLGVACAQIPSTGVDLTESMASTNRLTDATVNATATMQKTTLVLQQEVDAVQLMLNNTMNKIEQLTKQLLDGASNVTNHAGDVITVVVNTTLPHTVDQIVSDSLVKAENTVNGLVDNIFERAATRFINPVLISVSICVGALALACAYCAYARHGGTGTDMRYQKIGDII